MNPHTNRVKRMTNKREEDLIYFINWMSASEDFQVRGRARRGWLKFVKELKLR